MTENVKKKFMVVNNDHINGNDYTRVEDLGYFDTREEALEGAKKAFRDLIDEEANYTGLSYFVFEKVNEVAVPAPELIVTNLKPMPAAIAASQLPALDQAIISA